MVLDEAGRGRERGNGGRGRGRQERYEVISWGRGHGCVWSLARYVTLHGVR